MSKKISRYDIELLLGLISTFLIPINKPLVIFSMLGWLLVSLINLFIDRMQHQKYIIHQKLILPMLVFPTFYVLHAIGLFYSQNLDYGFFDLQIKMSMLLVPLLILFRMKIHQNRQREYFIALIFGCLVSFVINIFRAVIGYSTDGSVLRFFYSELSPDIHPSYLALYVGIGLIAILYFRQHLLNSWVKNKILNNVVLVFSVIVLLSYLVLLSSKAGIISFALVLAVYALIRLSQKTKLINALIVSALLFIIPFVVVKFIPSVEMRFKDVTDALKRTKEANIDSEYGSLARIAIIKSTWDMSLKNMPWGVGTGDIKDEITRYYIERGSKTISTHYLNAHNQYAQTTIALGFPGLMSLFIILITGFVLAFKKRQIIFLSFLLLLMIQMLFESMLEQQAGVIFITLFFTLFSIWDFDKKPIIGNS